MEQGGLIQPQLSLHADYSLPSDPECIDQYSGHSHQSAYTNGGAVDQLRRDGTLPPPAANPLTFAATNNARFVPDGGVASDAHNYKTGNSFTDSSSGSISTSPSSAASSLVYTSYPQTHYTGLTFPTTVAQPQAFLPSSYAATRVPSILENNTTSGMLRPPTYFRSTLPGATTISDRDAYAHTNHFLARGQLSPNGFGTFADTPRAIFSASGLPPLPPGPGGYTGHMASSTSQSYNGSQNDCHNFPWPNLECLTDMACDGQTVTPEVHAKVEKGFFLSTADNKWTCYRRNYFSVACNFELHPNIHNGRMTLKRTGTTETIQAMGMRLSAAVDGSSGKNIELVQHTPKRDAGPKTTIKITKVSPTPSTGRNDHSVASHGIYPLPMSTFHATGSVVGPHLPLQNSNESNGSSSSESSQTPQIASGYHYGGPHVPVPGQSTHHTFERVQFKQATANNGKRRASQQYFHLIVELFADIRKDSSPDPSWVKVAQRVSEKIVVRGRSPSHYQNEGQNGQAGRGGSASGGSSYGSTGGPGYTSLNTGGFRSATGGYGGSLGGGSGYRTNHYGFHSSSGDSASSPESADGGAVDHDHPTDTVMTDADRAGIQEYEGYQYYPSTIYENVPNQLPLPKIERSAQYVTEPHRYAVRAEYQDAVPGPQWQLGGCGRFQGVDGSRGYFPGITSPATYH